MSFDNSLCDRQTQSGTLPPALMCLPETVKHFRQILLCDARSLIRYRYQNPVIVKTSRNGDVAAFRRELNAIAQEVRQHLPQTMAVRQNFRQVCIDAAGEVLLFRFSERSHTV